MSIHQILKHHWGFDSFRPLQEDIINAVLEGKDVLALLPTGGGKSACFQVPALSKEGLCLVISPLIALMKDQVRNLEKKGIPSLAIYTGMNFHEIRKTLQNACYGNYKFLYVSPERLETNLFLEFLSGMKINLIAVDEAHCISQWGYDFRPTYTRIAAIREYLPGVPVLALTASATRMVQEDICNKLLFTEGYKRFQQSFERPELSYSVFDVPTKQIKLLEILNKVKGTAIVYCKSRKQTRIIAEFLMQHNITADYYHAGLSNEMRTGKQEDWIANRIRVIACTNAFGMGIDKPDVRVVVHYDTPDCLENYYQEAGRAGRDGKRAYAVLLHTQREISALQSLSKIRYPEKAEIKKIYTAIMNHLQISAGSGAGISYDFDISLFASYFKLNILSATYAIKALEQEEIISYNESFFKPSLLVFNCNKDDLNDFEIQNPELEPVIKGLLRSYEGIFDHPAVISENTLAKFISKTIEQVRNDLYILQKFGIIIYTPQNENPQITLLQNRMYADDFSINLTDYHKRKIYFEERVNAMIAYLTETNKCRSIYIADYFHAGHLHNCGICDNCINKKIKAAKDSNFEKIATHIINTVAKNSANLDEIYKKSDGITKTHLQKVIDYLLSEGILKTDTENRIILAKSKYKK